MSLRLQANDPASVKRFLPCFVVSLLVVLPSFSLNAFAEQNQSSTDYSQWGGAYTQEDSDQFWQALRLNYFGERKITEQQDIIKLKAPSRAENDAIVPVSLELTPASDINKISQVYLFVDVNPSPVAGIFTINPERSLDEIDTRVRVNGYTYIRAVAETTGGELYLDKKWVKSRGAGCSAPPTIDQAEHQQKLGKMRFRSSQLADNSELVQLMISHPNNTGMQTDQLTTMIIPQHYINEVEVWLGEEQLLHADTTFTLSENPSFRFKLDQEESAQLTAIVKDTEGNVFIHKQDSKTPAQ